MSMDKAIKQGKEHRKPWRGKNKSKNIDRSCCNHGGCDYCKSNRLYSFTKSKAAEQNKIDDWKEGYIMHWNVVGESFGELDIISSFYDYQDAIEFAESCDWCYIDISGRWWDLSVQEAV